MTIFQQLAYQKKHLFPCSYASNGCTFKDKFGAISKHEIKCNRRTIVCPVKDCGQELLASKIEDHCYTFHNGFIIDNIESINLRLSDLKECKSSAKLYFEDKLSLVFVYKIEGDNIKFLVKSLTANKSYLKYNLSVLSRDAKRHIRFSDEYFSKSKYLDLTSKDLKYILNRDNQFMVSISLQKIQFNEGFLCYNCEDYSKDSSGQKICLVTTHQLCNKCFRDLKFCISCASKNLQKSLFLCPISSLQNCDNRYKIQKVLEHFKKDHQYVLIGEKVSSLICYTKNLTASISFIKVHENCFKCLRSIENGSIFVKVMLIGLDFDKFRFNVLISSGSKSFSVSHPVFPLMDDPINLNKSLKIDAYLLKSFLTSYKFNLTITIDKI